LVLVILNFEKLNIYDDVTMLLVTCNFLVLLHSLWLWTSDSLLPIPDSWHKCSPLPSLPFVFTLLWYPDCC